jgi:hypothetical protein
MKAAVSLTDVASTGMPKAPGSSEPGFVGRVWSTVAEFRGRVLGTASFVNEKLTTTASQAKTRATDAGKGLFAIVAAELGSMKVRGLNAVDFAGATVTKARNGITTRVTSVKDAVAASYRNTRERSIEVGSVVQKRALGYVPVGIKSSIASTYGYITDKVSAAHNVAASVCDRTRVIVLTHATSTQAMVNGMMDSGKAKAVNLGTLTQTTVMKYAPAPVKEMVSDPKAKTAAVGAAGGAVAMGATGGAVGMASGSVLGAVVGLVPALFTFGLSIPVGAVLGGSAGLCVGTAVGGTTGLVAGGAAGYNKDKISKSTTKAFAQAKDTAGLSRQFVLKQVATSASFVKARVHTGGTEGLISESD